MRRNSSRTFSKVTPSALSPRKRVGQLRRLAADLTMLVCYTAVTLLFYDLLRTAGRRLSLLAAFFSLVGIAVLAVNSLNHLAPCSSSEARNT